MKVSGGKELTAMLMNQRGERKKEGEDEGDRGRE